MLRIRERGCERTGNGTYETKTLTYGSEFDCDEVEFDDDDDGARDMCIDCDTVISSFAVDLGVSVRSARRPNRFDRPDDSCRYFAAFDFDGNFHRFLRFHRTQFVCFGAECAVDVHANRHRSINGDNIAAYFDLNLIFSNLIRLWWIRFH